MCKPHQEAKVISSSTSDHVAHVNARESSMSQRQHASPQSVSHSFGYAPHIRGNITQANCGQSGYTNVNPSECLRYQCSRRLRLSVFPIAEMSAVVALMSNLYLL